MPSEAWLQVLRTGPLALLQDLGRAGFAHIGVPHAGAADRRAHMLANRLVGNPHTHATLEITHGGFTARVHGRDVDIAVTGADADPSVNGIPFGTNSVAHVHAGQTIALGQPRAGMRSYLAVRGGFAVTPVLDSRSHDTLSRLGPPPLRQTDTLPIGDHSDAYPGLDLAPVAPITGEPLELTVVPGPRDDWFSNTDVLIHTDWVATDRSDRIGTRLSGPTLIHRRAGRQLPSEGTTRGAIQVPPNGQPVILGPDHPVTGGYPVIGVVADADTDRLAQVRPGQVIRMRWAR
ncbi:MAG: biotin-dependent carboxyltransferase family protein [Mycobacterium sp.]